MTFADSVELLVNQVSHWTPARWRGRTQAFYHVLQAIADATADVEGVPRHAVPQLPEFALADQLRVLAADLMAASPEPEVLERAAQAVTDLRRTLSAI